MYTEPPTAVQEKLPHNYGDVNVQAEWTTDNELLVYERQSFLHICERNTCCLHLQGWRTHRVSVMFSCLWEQNYVTFDFRTISYFHSFSVAHINNTFQIKAVSCHVCYRVWCVFSDGLHIVLPVYLQSVRVLLTLSELTTPAALYLYTFHVFQAQFTLVPWSWGDKHTAVNVSSHLRVTALRMSGHSFLVNRRFVWVVLKSGS